MHRLDLCTCFEFYILLLSSSFYYFRSHGISLSEQNEKLKPAAKSRLLNISVVSEAITEVLES